MRLLKDVLGEIAAALVGALVTIYLVDTANKHELRESVEETCAPNWRVSKASEIVTANCAGRSKLS